MEENPYSTPQRSGDIVLKGNELSESRQAATMRKVAVRLLPLLLLSYMANLLDRSNVGFTKSQMQGDLGMSDTAYAFNQGMFYFGYLVFEVPSNLILRRTGARLWIARIMITWAAISAVTMFVTGPWTFLCVRILLGVAEAGFFPGVILYLTYWFSARERTRAVAAFMLANAVGGVFNNPLSGMIMQYLDKTAGLHGWQWVFLLESLPSFILAGCVFFWLTDRPAEARWLADDERQWLVERMSQEEQHRSERHGSDLLRAALSGRVWYLIALYFTIAFCSNAGSLYLPELTRNRFAAASDSQIGLLAAIPYLCGAIGMLVNGWLSDRTQKYRLHVGLPALVGAAGWLLATMTTSPVWGLVGFSLAVMGVMSMLPPFWSLPTSFLSGAAAAGGIALINSVANIGGLLGPTTVGWMNDATQNPRYGLAVLSGTLVLSAILAFFAPHDVE